MYRKVATIAWWTAFKLAHPLDRLLRQWDDYREFREELWKVQRSLEAISDEELEERLAR